MGDPKPRANVTLEDEHAQLTQRVAHAISGGAVPFVIGGGNDQSYANGIRPPALANRVTDAPQPPLSCSSPHRARSRASTLMRIWMCAPSRTGKYIPVRGTVVGPLAAVSLTLAQDRLFVFYLRISASVQRISLNSQRRACKYVCAF